MSFNNNVRENLDKNIVVVVSDSCNNVNVIQPTTTVIEIFTGPKGNAGSIGQPGPTGSISASNGLNISSSIVKLGGDLTEDTFIDSPNQDRSLYIGSNYRLNYLQINTTGALSLYNSGPNHLTTLQGDNYGAYIEHRDFNSNSSSKFHAHGDYAEVNSADGDGNENMVQVFPTYTNFPKNILVTGSLTVSGSNTFKNIGPAIFSGSINVSGSSVFTGSVQGDFTGSLLGTASYANQALTASHLLNATPPFPYTGSAEITGSLGVTGSFNILSGSLIINSPSGSNLYTITQNVNLKAKTGTEISELILAKNYSQITGMYANWLYVGGTRVYRSEGGYTEFTQLAVSNTAYTPFNFIVPSQTNQISSSNLPNFKVTGLNKQWATGNITNQYWNYLTGNTASFVGASTITSSYGLYVEEAQGGTNAIITNNFAAGFSGSIYTSKNIGIQNTSPKDAIHIGINDGTFTGNIQIPYGNVIGSVIAANTALGAAGANALGYYLPTNAQGNSLLVNTSAGAKINYRAFSHIFNVNNFSGYSIPTIEFPTFVVSGSNTAFSVNGTIATQRWNYFMANTASFNILYSGSITNAYNLYVDAPVMGTGATSSGIFALGAGGNIHATGQYLVLGTSSPNLGTNYTLRAVSGNTYLNTLGVITDNLQLQIAGTTRFNIFGATASNPRFSFVPANVTSTPTGTETSGYLFNSYSKEWVAGNITTQRELYFKSVTYTATSSSLFTNVYGAYFEAPTISTNVTASNNYAIGAAGNISLTGQYFKFIGSIANAYIDNSQGGNLRLNVGSGAGVFVDINGSFMSAFTVAGLGIYVSSPKSYLHIAASSGGVNTTPIKLNAGTLVSTPESGSFEFNGNNLYFTTGSTRNTLLWNNNPASITGSLSVTGSIIVNTSGTFVLPQTASSSPPQIGSMYFTGSFIYVYDGTQYRSASLS